MRIFRNSLIAWFLAVSTCSFPVNAETVDLKDLLAGTRAPLDHKLKDLDHSWRRISLAGSSDAFNYLAAYARLFGTTGNSFYYTKGETVPVAGETYLIAYRSQTKAPDMSAVLRGGTPPPPEPLTPETPLALSLIQLRTAGSLTDIRPFNLEQELAEQYADRGIFEEGQQNASHNTSLSNLKQIGLGIAMYADEHNDKLPDLTDVLRLKQALLPKFISNEKVFVQPRTGEPYATNPSLSEHAWQGPNASDTIVVYESRPAGDGSRTSLFLDGHVERLSEARWQKLMRSSGIP
jgi:hypothetical protein